MELTDRKKQILKVVTERYIDAAEPVSSKFIAQAMGGRLSSATIRNELADLVELGYLEQPHTSAGRVPSPKGYRLYVNELMEKRSVSDQEAAQINEALGGQLRELDAIIARAGQAASAIVSYPAYAVAAGRGSVTVRRYDLLPVDAESFIAVVMTVDSRVKSQLLRTQLPVEPQQLPARRTARLGQPAQHPLHRHLRRGDGDEAHGPDGPAAGGAVHGGLPGGGVRLGGH